MAPAYRVSTDAALGGRRTQEDRFLFQDLPESNAVLLAVFDGTVGDFVADHLAKNYCDVFLSTAGWKAFLETRDTADEEKLIGLLEAALRAAFAQCDSDILEVCDTRSDADYCASTGVVAIVTQTLIVTAHVGDSRAALVHAQAGYIWGEFLTADHKPDLPIERARIEAAGGHVVYLASRDAKPFIRGGDFEQRKLLGQQPMQLQYSRAFGGKNLKNFGLSAEPAVRVYKITNAEYALVLATDGLWDTMTASQAANIVVGAKKMAPAEALVNHVLSSACDNVTAVVLVL